MNFTSELLIIVTILVLLIIIGLFGNTISMFIFANKRFRNESPSFYLIFSSVINVITLVYLPIAALPTIWAINNLSCKLFGGLVLVIYQIQSFAVAFCSLDRVITVYKPFKYLFKNKLKFQLPLVIITSFLIICFVIPAPYFYNREINSENQAFCAFSNDPEYFWALNYFKVQFLLLRTVIPFIIMIASSSLIYWKIKSNRNKLRVLNVSQKRSYQMGITLIALDILFIIFRFPTLLNTVLSSNGEDKIVYSFTYSMFVLIAATHNSFSFLICISFNKTYRVFFFKYLKKIKIFLKKTNRIIPS